MLLILILDDQDRLVVLSNHDILDGIFNFTFHLNLQPNIGEQDAPFEPRSNTRAIFQYIQPCLLPDETTLCLSDANIDV